MSFSYLFQKQPYGLFDKTEKPNLKINILIKYKDVKLGFEEAGMGHKAEGKMCR